MPRYITASDVFTLEGYNLTTSVISSTTVNEYIDDAEAVIHGKVAKKYNVPFTATAIPRLIKKIDKSLAGYYSLAYLHQQNNRNRMSDSIRLKHDDAFDLLDQIYDGSLILFASATSGSLEEVAQAVDNTMKATYDDIPPIVNMDDEYKWAASTSLLDDIDERRQGAE